jgi:hypothetical protein
VPEHPAAGVTAMTINEIIEDSLDLFDEPAETDGKYNRDGYRLLTRLANRIYVDVCKKTQCHRTKTTIVTNPEQREYALPSDTIGVKKVLFQGLPMTPISEFDAIHSGGYPAEYYTIDRSFIGFNPVPPDSLEMTVHYFARPIQTITGDESPKMVPEDYHYVISYGVAAELFKIDKGDRSDGFAKWNGIYLIEIDSMKADLRKNRDKFPCV